MKQVSKREAHVWCAFTLLHLNPESLTALVPNNANGAAAVAAAVSLLARFCMSVFFSDSESIFR